MVPQLATSVSALAGSSTDSYRDFVNPQWVKLLTLLGMNVKYERWSGCELFPSASFWTEALSMARRAFNI